MSAERKTGNSIERGLWKGTGIVITLEAIRLLATLSQPKTEAEALEMMGLVILIPMWSSWGDVRSWLKEDFSRLANFFTREDISGTTL